MTPDELYQSASSLYPDEIAIPGTGIDDLDREWLRERRPEAFDDGAPVPTVLRAMHLLGDDGLTLGGLLCFGKEPQRLRPYARITAIRFAGTDVAEEYLDSQDYSGRLERQYRDAIAFARRHVVQPGAVLGASPPRLPLQVVEEAIVNALVHRDYLAASQIRLFIFDDRVELRSPGRLLNSVTVEAMRYGCHVVRNPVIFTHFADLKLARDAGIGVRNMYRLMKSAGLPPPEIAAVGGELAVTLRSTP